MRFEFATAGRILFGPGTHRELAELCAPLGRRALLVTGRGAREREPAAGLINDLEQRLSAVVAPVQGEPTTASVEALGQQAKETGCNMVIGIGGGSVLDAAKAAAALASNPGRAMDYLEVVGLGKPLESPALPILAVPTTAGTGSEVTRNAVVGSPEHRVKASIRHPSMLPRLALVDPLLTHTSPPSVTASSGLDALTQLLEAYVSVRAQPMTDGFCTEGLARVGWALRRAYADPGDAEAREAMSTASLLSGLALSNAGLGAVHGIAGVIGGAFDAPHGAVCAALLPTVTSINVWFLRKRDPTSTALQRYSRAAEILFPSTGRKGPPRAEALVDHLDELVQSLSIPGLSHYGVSEGDIPTIAAQAMKANSTRGNPIVLEQGGLEKAISAAI